MKDDFGDSHHGAIVSQFEGPAGIDRSSTRA
jgi:hypothetical protein